MLLLFILIGLLALGLPLMLMLFGDPPAPPPVQAKPAIVQPAPVAAAIEVPQAASSETAPQTSEAPMSATTAASLQVPQPAIPVSTVTSQPTTPAGETASIPGLAEGSKLPSDAELLKELQRLLNEQAKSGK